VFVSSLGKKATVLKVEHSKKEILVQVGIMKMKVKLTDVVA
jgi:dsDNA-specific endonuclease/ATPase MutS2